MSCHSITLILLWAMSQASYPRFEGGTPSIRGCTVEIEEIVTKPTLADNSAGPLWCYGSTVIARRADDVFLSVIGAGKDVPPLCNTRWQLWHRSSDGWRLEQSENEYRQREPCLIALFQRGPVFLSVNPSIEPVEEWRKLKFEVLKRDWDYVFRRLFYTYSNNIRTSGFCMPLEIDTVEELCGHIQNLDLHVDEMGAAHLLYLKRPHQYEFIRDKYFPGQAMMARLEYAVVKEGNIVSTKTLAQTPAGPTGFEPFFGRFHIASSGDLYVIAADTATDKNQRTFGNYLGRIEAKEKHPAFERIELKHPLHSFFTNTSRGGSAPSDVIDLFATADDGSNLRYARIRIEPPRS